MIEAILGPQGILARHLPGYEYRPGQIRMAEEVERALSSEGQLLVEAGTGTGKTLAYLIPALYSGLKVIVSTGSKNLQEQLYQQDIPFLHTHLPIDFKVCYMKGRNNYLCRRRWSAFRQQPLFADPEEAALMEMVEEWAPSTPTGDRSELEGMPDLAPFWQDVCAKSELCTGQKCPYFNNCFITRMKQEAFQSDLVVVNHHLFFADLALRSGSYGEVIPPYDAVIFDEAHQVEEVATAYFGTDLSNYHFEELIRDTERELLSARAGGQELRSSLDKLNRHQQGLFFSFADKGERFRLTGRSREEGAVRAAELIHGLKLIAASLETLPEGTDELTACARRAHELALKVDNLFAAPREDQIYWGENRGRGCFLHASPLDVAPMLEEKLYQRVETVIFTSATLTTQGDFTFCKRQLGLHAPRESVVEEHFNYREQVAVYAPKNLPNPNQAHFLPAIGEEIEQVLNNSAGRALVLFTSYQQLKEVYRRLKKSLPYLLLCQGLRPRGVLLKRFRRNVNSVLLATNSFWQGVDVPGEALSCLIIVKLPFAVPSDPLLAARLEHIEKKGGNPFIDYQLPKAAILLRQGFGRLIRKKEDRGVLVLLDKRISNRSYGKIFWESLPSCRRLLSREEIAPFLGRGGGMKNKELTSKKETGILGQGAERPLNTLTTKGSSRCTLNSTEHH